VSKIEWCDKTWNPVVGCSHAGSPGCDNCYALSFARRHAKNPTLPAEAREAYSAALTDGKWNGTCHFIPHVLDKPLHWKKPRRIFVCSMGDIFHPDVSVTRLEEVLAVIARCPQHTFLMLTKRADRLGLMTSDRLRLCPGTTWPLPNLHLGVTVETPGQLGRTDELLRIPAAVHWVSLEPLLAAMDLRAYLPHLDWVVLGPETGPGARPMDLDWARSVRDQCAETDTPFFLKKIKLDGRSHHEFPRET